MKKIFIILMLSIMAGTNSFSETTDTTGTAWRPVQVTFLTPVGSNGLASWKTGNNFSLNILFGMNGALKGTELSGLAGLLRGNMEGAQFAGLVNTAGGDVRGFQAAGLVNVAGGTFSGAQTAGLVNVAAHAGKGFQAAGLVNVAMGTKLSQVAGLASVQAGDVKGVQINGLAGVTTGKIDGVQISGLVNYTKTLHGVQVGLFNYADTVEKGTPVGLFSIVRHGGYRAFELSANETFYGNASFKLGVKQLYSIFTTGAAIRNDTVVWGWGLGFGTLIPLSKKTDLSIEGICYQVNVGEWFTHGPNLLNKISFSFGWHVAKGVALTFTPSWNVTVTDTINEYGETVEKSFTPYDVYDHTFTNGINVKMYPGMAVGVRF
jgi:hypothetical protein